MDPDVEEDLPGREPKISHYKRDKLSRKFGKYFSGTTPSSWKQLDPHASYKVYAFCVCRVGRYLRVGIFAHENKVCQSVYILKGFLKKKLIRLYEEAGDGLVCFPYNNNTDADGEIVCRPSKRPILSFKTNGMSTFQGVSFATVVKERFYPHDDANVDDDEQHMRGIKRNVSVAQCKRLESFAGKSKRNLVIGGIKVVQYKKKTRFILKFDGVRQLYFSNYWLEKELDKFDWRYKIKIEITGVKRTTPTNHLEMFVVCTEGKLLERETTNPPDLDEEEIVSTEEQERFYTDDDDGGCDGEKVCAQPRERCRGRTAKKMKQIKRYVKVVECRRLESLEKGEVTVCGIKAVQFRNRIRYVLQLQGEPHLYLSNYWLDEELEDVDLEYQFTVEITGVKRNNPSNDEEMFVMCKSAVLVAPPPPMAISCKCETAASKKEVFEEGDGLESKQGQTTPPPTLKIF